MSTYEYNDLFINCQDTGKYHMFVFDIENSKQMDDQTRMQAQYQIIDLSLTMYKKLQEKEKEENRQILVFEKDFNHFWEEKKYKGFGVKTEPFLYGGDTIGFTIYRDSVSEEEVMSIFEKTKEELGIKFNMHSANGYYETNDYKEGATKYFRGYCVDLLGNIHKEKYSDVRDALSHKKR